MTSRGRRGAQTELRFRTWGGRRKNAGRKAKGPIASERHLPRPALSKRHPVHVVLRTHVDVHGLRNQRAYAAFRRAMVSQIRRHDFRICHLSIQRTHLHLIVEAHDERALARGMQGFQVSAAKHLNGVLLGSDGARRRGCVFPDRYRAEILTTPRHTRHALAYVINNWRKHHEDRATRARRWLVDRYSTAVWVPHWRELDRPFAWPRDYEPLPAKPPHTWLLQRGWRKHGDLSLFEQPGPRRPFERRGRRARTPTDR